MMYTKLNNLRILGLEAFAFSRWSGIICLVVLLCLGSTAKAEEYNLYVAGTQVTSDNANDVLGDGAASFDASSNILTIKGDITAPDNETSCIKGEIDNLTIKVANIVTLSSAADAIEIRGNNTTITGGWKLTISVTSDRPGAFTIANYNGDLYVTDAYLILKGSLGCGLGHIYIKNSNLSLTGSIANFGGNLDIVNSTVSVESTKGSAINGAGGKLSIDNSSVTAKTTDPSTSAISGWLSLETVCNLKTPQGGHYDTESKKFIEVDGKDAYKVEISPRFIEGGLYYDVEPSNKVKLVSPTKGKYVGAIIIPATVKHNDVTYNVVAIGDNAFKGATGVTSVKLPLKNLTSIGSYAFNDCTGLTEFTLPECITSIGEKAFYYCDKLQHLYVHSSNPGSYYPGKEAFSYINRAGNVCTLHVPSGTTQAYNDHERFDVFTQVEEYNNYNIFVKGTLVTNLNAEDVLGDGAASYDASKNTLTISGDITASDASTSCIYTKLNDLTIQIAAPSTLKATDNAIFIECKERVEGKHTTITGSSKLTISVSSDNNDATAIFQKSGDIVITDADLSLDGSLFYHMSHMTINNTNISIAGSIIGWGHLNVYNSTMSVEGQGGIGCLGGTFRIENSTVTAHRESSGSVIHGWADLILNGCYLSNPLGGSYDTKSFELKDADGNKVQTMEIVPGVDPGLYIAGKYVSSKNASDILGDRAASYDEGTKTLTINGNITAPDENTPCIKSGVDGLTIQVAAPATLSATDNAIYLQGENTTITGSPNLTVSATSKDGSTTAIYQEKGTLSITKANLLIIGKTSCSEGNLSIVKSKISAAGDISGAGALLIEKSTVTAMASDPTEPVIAGWKSLTLNTCTMTTPEGGHYNTYNRMVVDANGNYSPTVEIQIDLVKGDANGDGDVDKDDIAAVVNYIMTGERDGFYYNNADLNGDTIVNAADLVLLINQLK